MYADTSKTVAVSGDLDADDTTEMTLDQDGMVHLMSVLTNLYSDKHLAVLREYSTNARDSHIAAGNTDPISVTLPTALNPTLVISDAGVGLSRREIVEVYSRYGASTKRASNEQVGSFGLGAKSAFTIGGQFVVTATKDGVRTVAVFALNAHGVGTVNILDERAVDAPNGVTVDIAVSEWRAMRAAADRFFRAWAPGTVLVDGREPADTYFTADDAMWLGDDVLYSKDAGLTVIMGGVAYPLPESARQQVRARTGANWPLYGGDPGLVVFVPIGAVDITPSREAIRDTARSIDAVVRVLDNLPVRLADKITEVKAAHPGVTAWVLAARPWLKLAKHLRVPVDGSLPADIRIAPGEGTSYGLTSRGGLSVTDADVVSAGTLHQVVVLVGVPERRSARRHAKAWLEENGNYRRHQLIMIGNGSATSGSVDWFAWGGADGVPTMHYDDIEVPEANGRGGARNRITYQVHTPDAAGVWGPSRQLTPADLKASPLPVVWVHSFPDGAPLHGYRVVVLSSRQSADVLVRRVPEAKSGRAVIEAWTAARLAAVGDLNALGRSMVWGRMITRIADTFDGGRLARVTSPRWAALQSKGDAYQALSEADKMLVRRNFTGQRDVEAEVKAEMDALLPLLSAVSGWYWQLSDAAKDALVDHVNTLA